MKKPLTHEPLIHLLSAACDQRLEHTELQRLEAVLRESADARQCYNNYMFLHAELYAQHALLASVENGPHGNHSSRPMRQRVPRLLALGIAGAIAAGLGGLILVAGWTRDSADSTTNAVVSSGQAPKSEHAPLGMPAAKITSTRNCLWSEQSRGIGFGSRLHAGQTIELHAGLVEITFNDGAAVVLEGPARFTVRASHQAQLEAGRLSAVVPRRARGFEVATPRVNIVDVGTEFGLMANESGTTEIHCFNGLVKAQLLDEAGNEMRLVELTSSEGARIQPATALVARIPARHDEFVRTLSVALGPHDGLYAYDGFNYPAGPLAEQNGGFGWAGPWFNVEADAKLDANSNGVEPGNLEYDGLVSVGNRAVQTAQQNRVRRTLGTSVGGVFDAAGLVENQDGMRLVGRDGTTVYVSFLQRVNKLNDVFYGFELHRSDGNFNRVLCIGNGAEGTGYGATSNYNVYGAQNFPVLGDENSEVNFFVVRITFGTENRDLAEIIRNPESLVEESRCRVDAQLNGNFAFDRISLGNFHGTKVHEVDEIRVGTTYRAVTGQRSRSPDRLAPRVAVQFDSTRFQVHRHLMKN